MVYESGVHATGNKSTFNLPRIFRTSQRQERAPVKLIVDGSVGWTLGQDLA